MQKLKPEEFSDKYQEFLKRLNEERLEFIDGEIVPIAAPSKEHSEIHSHVSLLLGPFSKFKRDGGPGGWRFYTELDIQIRKDLWLRPDVCGFCLERYEGDFNPEFSVPDWVCEILSPSNPKHDQITKRHLYATIGVPFYWIIDSRQPTPILEALIFNKELKEWVARAFSADDTHARVPPFEAVELNISELLST